MFEKIMDNLIDLFLCTVLLGLIMAATTAYPLVALFSN